MERKEIVEIYNRGPDAVVNLVNTLIESFTKKINQLEERVFDLEKQLAKNSSNSSKPPSSDGLKKKVKNNRKETNRKSGGQKGHKGNILEMSPNPDFSTKLPLKDCHKCGRKITAQAVSEIKRQVFDIPDLKFLVHEIIGENKICVHCKELNTSQFPEHIKRPTQYGPNLRSLIVYLNQYQLIPYERTAEFISDIFSHPISQGTIYNIIDDCYKKLETTEKIIKERISNSEIVHFDESGGYCEKVRQWFHVASTNSLTYFGFHKKRGREAMDEIDILPRFNGKAVHDFYPSYFTYGKEDILCNSHLCRELIFLHEEENQKWAFDLEKLILTIKKAVDKEREKSDKSGNNSLSVFLQNKFNDSFDKILSNGLKKNPKNKGTPGKRGRKPQSNARNILDRLLEWKNSYLAFMTDFSIPFDNNQAERDVRMLKLQQKISGTFRSSRGAKIFCRIRGYISTVKKNKIGIFYAIKSIFVGNSEIILKNC